MSTKRMNPSTGFCPLVTNSTTPRLHSNRTKQAPFDTMNEEERELIIAAINCKRFLDPLPYNPDEVRDDKDIILAAVKTYGLRLKHASKTLRGDREVVMAAVKESSEALEHASKELKADKEIVMAAVKRDGRALTHASKELQGDKEVVMAAVKNDGYALGQASESLRGDKEVVIAAVKNHSSAFVFASSEMKRDYDVALAAMKGFPCVWRYLPTYYFVRLAEEVVSCVDHRKRKAATVYANHKRNEAIDVGL